MKLLESNLEMLARRQPELASHIRGLSVGKVEIFATPSGCPSANYAHSEQKIIPLHSKYNPLKEARAKLREYDLNSSDYVVLLGFGLGYLMDAILETESTRDKKYFIVESDSEVLRAAFEARDLSGILSLPALHFAWPVSNGELSRQWQGFFDPVHAQQSMFVMHSPSLAIDPGCYKAAAKSIQSQTLQIFTDINTLIAKSEAFLENFIKNLRHTIESPGVSQFAGRFRKTTAILVSAGPSLDKNIHELARYRNKAVIVSTDTALKPLLKAGIEPHFVMTGDPSEANYLHIRDAGSKDAYLVAEATAHPGSFEEFKGRTISCTYHDSSLGSLSDLLESKGKLRAWGSVATMALDFALLLGCDPVVFLGQDLAYSDNRTYCSGIYFIERFFADTEDAEAWHLGWKKLREQGKTVAMQDIFGKPILTNDRMASYWNWFVKELSQHSHTTFINATEGGILKEHTQIMSAREALYRHCNRDLSLFRDIRVIFEGENNQPGDLGSKLIGFKKETEQIQKLINRGRSICGQYKSADPLPIAQELDAVKTAIYANTHIAGVIDIFNQLGNVTFLRRIASVKKSPAGSTAEEIVNIYGEYLDSAAKAAEKINAALCRIEDSFFQK